ncbi:MAG: hypothetical protein QM673_06080 [Gordonia sp. (in: high G+C Gram-positive bacteria)]
MSTQQHRDHSPWRRVTWLSSGIRTEIATITSTRSLWLLLVIAVVSAPAVSLLVQSTSAPNNDADLVALSTRGAALPLLLWAGWGAVASGGEYTRGGIAISAVIAGSRNRLVTAKFVVAAVISAIGSGVGSVSAAAATYAALPADPRFGSVPGLLALSVVAAAVTVVGVALGFLVRSASAAALLAAGLLLAPKAAGGLLGRAQQWVTGASPATVIREIIAADEVAAVQRFPLGAAAGLAVVVAVAIGVAIWAATVFARRDI